MRRQVSCQFDLFSFCSVFLPQLHPLHERSVLPAKTLYCKLFKTIRIGRLSVCRQKFKRLDLSASIVLLELTVLSFLTHCAFYFSMSNVLAPVEISYPGLDRLLDGRYQVIQVLETGSWGHTYLAQDTRRPSQPECVIQHVIPAKNDPIYQAALRQVFVREAATLERLGEHEQIPQLLACFEDVQGFHLVQESVSGTALSLELISQPWQEARVVQLLLECLEVLAVVHHDCCRHGDIRPANLMRRSQDGALILTNFGMVRDIHLSLMTLQGQSVFSMVPNSQGYQPPEQVQGLPCLASDIYAVGLIGIQALTGVPPLQLDREALTGELCWQPFGQTAGSTLRHGLVAVLSRMVRADQTQRYPSAQEALQAIRQLAQVGLLSPVSQQSMAAAIVPSSQPQTLSSALALRPPDPDTLAERLFSPAVQIGVGIGAVMAAAVCGYALPHLLDRALYGDSEHDSPATAETTQRQQTEQLPKAMLSVVTTPTPEQAVSPAEAAAAQALRAAYDRAIVKDFTGAIASLNQIGADTSVYPNVQEKLREYREKQQIQAVSRLQAAYNQAEAKAFDKALESLQQISSATPTYATAQIKIREYTEKQRIRVDVLAMQDLNPGSYLQETNVAGR